MGVVYTYFEDQGMGDGPAVDVWREVWSKAGWDPKVLTQNDAAKHPLFATTVMAKPFVFLCDPEAIQEVFSTKNRLLDKTESAAERFKELLGNSFLFALADEDWKTKRKATAHAFYKDRLVNMMDCLKGKLAERCAAWIKTAEDEGKVRIDIALEFEKIFAKNLIHIAFGEDISE